MLHPVLAQLSNVSFVPHFYSTLERRYSVHVVPSRHPPFLATEVDFFAFAQRTGTNLPSLLPETGVFP